MVKLSKTSLSLEMLLLECHSVNQYNKYVFIVEVIQFLVE